MTATEALFDSYMTNSKFQTMSSSQDASHAKPMSLKENSISAPSNGCSEHEGRGNTATLADLATQLNQDGNTAAMETTTAILSKIYEWKSFDVFKLDACSGGRPLRLVTMHLLKSLGVVHRLSISVARLSAFLEAAESRYTPQPYHNNTHAADVVQALGSMMAADAWAAAFEDWELLAVVIAAAVHDLGHPGVNNDFHMRTNSEAAQSYKHIGSINENGHASLALSLLLMPENDFVAELGAEKAETFKNLLKNLVLSTDMAHHASVVDNFAKSLNEYGPDLTHWSVDCRHSALKMLLHCADISNPARPLQHCTEWGRRVQEELYGQGDKERELGLPLTPACDRSSSCPSRSQAAFIKHIMKPSIAALAPIAPKFVDIVMPSIDESFDHWNELAGGPPSPTKVPICGVNGERSSSADVITYLAP